MFAGFSGFGSGIVAAKSSSESLFGSSPATNPGAGMFDFLKKPPPDDTPASTANGSLQSQPSGVEPESKEETASGSFNFTGLPRKPQDSAAGKWTCRWVTTCHIKLTIYPFHLKETPKLKASFYPSSTSMVSNEANKDNSVCSEAPKPNKSSSETAKNDSVVDKKPTKKWTCE